MNNKSKILIGSLILLMVISIGYALFSDSINVSGTAHAKGTYDLHFESCTRGLPKNVPGDPELKDNGKGESSCIISNSTNLNLSAKFDRSEIGYIYTAKLVNSGTIPVVIGEGDLVANICQDGYTWNYDKNNFTQVEAPNLKDNTITSEECFSSTQLTGGNWWEGLVFTIAYAGAGGVTPKFYDSNGTEIENIAGYIINPNNYINIVIMQMFAGAEGLEDSFLITSEGDFSIVSSQVTN